jgi:hypothetical protein
MRRSLSNRLKLAFRDGLLQRIKGIVPVALPHGPPGSLAWCVGESDRATAYVILFVSPRNDRFTIELAWSSQKRIPNRNDMDPGEEADLTELRFRLSRLWRPTGFEVWYDLEHEEDYPDVEGLAPFPTDEQVCLQRIPEKVKRALDALEDHGLPYLRRVVGLPTSAGEEATPRPGLV